VMEILAPAKINLSLRILGKRPDGFHEIESLVQKVDLFDRITFTNASDNRISLVCSDPDIPGDENNLAHRAAVILAEAAGVRDRGVRIELEKNIPSGAGLGGGSSDAAAVLMGLSSFWDFSPNTGFLADLGAQLGSDVPLFLYPSPAIIKGRGEIVLPLTARLSGYFVIIYPGFSVPSQWAYSNFRLTKTADKYRISALSKAEGGELLPDDWSSLLVNDLEAAVIQKYPEIAKAKEALLEAGARAALMSGSGSAVFGLFDERETAHRAAGIMSVSGGYRIITAKPLLS